MAKSRFIEFEKARGYILDKDKALNAFIRQMLIRTQSMFAYTGLPETIPQSSLEYILQTEGYAFVTEVQGSLYALSGSLGGEPDPYGDFTTITVSNVALRLSETYSLADDGVLINSDSLRNGLLPILNKYGVMLTENTISIRTVDIMLRMSAFISASDDRTKAGADKFIKDIEDGKISAIAESAFFDGVKIQSVANSQNYLTQFSDLEQYLKASCWNEIGLNGNYNMKREYIGNAESALNDDLLLPLVDNMIKERQTALDKINSKYGTDIKIDFTSSWKVTHSENEKQVSIAEGFINGDVLNMGGLTDAENHVPVLPDEERSQSEETGSEEPAEGTEPEQEEVTVGEESEESAASGTDDHEGRVQEGQDDAEVPEEPEDEEEVKDDDDN